MIYVDRSRVELPPKVASRLRREAEEAARFFRRSRRTAVPQTRAQVRFQFTLIPEMKPLLLELFHNKCAYCERALESADSEIELFRPRLAARSLEGDEAPDHYWWLAYEWENHLVACTTCNANKGTFFPVLASQRASVEMRGESLDREIPMLIDPTRQDPLQHLRFDRDGTVVPLSREGETTIAVIGLQREILVSERRRALTRMLDLMARPLDVRSASPIAPIQAMVADDAIHAGAARSVLRELLATKAIRDERIRQAVQDVLAPFAHEVPSTASLRTSTLSIPKAKGVIPEQVPFGYLAKIRIRNFRAIERLDLEFVSGTTERSSWKVLLGENAAGKSTVLKAIALCLMGQARVNALKLEPKQLLRRWRVPDATQPRGFRNEHAQSASIRLTSQRGDVIEVRISPKRIRFRSGATGMQGVVRGYGSLRLLPGPGVGADPAQELRADNLFDPATPLVSAREWMQSRRSNDFSGVGKALKALLGIEGEEEIESVDDGVWFPLNNSSVELDDLSDGYQSMVALAVDLMAGMPGNVYEMKYVPGIVLLDELGTHLHPRWRMQVVRRLRETFSNLQVIASTHEPLCLLGLDEKEIAVMRRDSSGAVEVVTDVPAAKGMRADQILTSPLFGLHSTIDEEIDKKFQRYYVLLAAPELTPAQKEQREQLASELQRIRVLGYTRRDQLIYETIDTFLAKEQAAKNQRARKELLESTKKTLAKIWSRVDAAAGRS